MLLEVVLVLPNTVPNRDFSDRSIDDASRNRLQDLLIALSKRTHGFIQSSRESRLAKRTCTFYLGKHNKDGRKTCQTALKTHIQLRPNQLLNFLESSVGTDFLKRLGKLFHWPNDDNSHQSLKEMLIKTAADPEGMSLIKLLNKITAFPLNTDQVLLTSSRFKQLLQVTRMMVTTIHSLSVTEAEQSLTQASLTDQPDPEHPSEPSIVNPVDAQALQPEQCDSKSLKKRTFPGACSVPGTTDIRQRVLDLYDEERDRTLRVLVFIPDARSFATLPLVVLSHGLGSNPEDMAVYAKFLTSHGFVTAALQHPGSDSSHIRNMLNGESNEVFQLTEFVDRPLDVTFVLDYLAQQNTFMFGGRLNLESVGVMGHSFGGYTAFALAGGTIQFNKLETACGPVFNAPNLSLFLQCRALELPRKRYDLCDRRVQAIFVLDSVGSEVFGRKGLHHIHVPVFLIAGSEDRMTPAALEQIRIFPWLMSPHRYLGLIEGKSHINNLRKLISVLELDVEMPESVLPNDTDILDTYINTLSTAFFMAFIAQDDSYTAYLQSDYAQFISEDAYPLSLISSASSDALESALETIGAQLVADSSDAETQTVLEESSPHLS